MNAGATAAPTTAPEPIAVPPIDLRGLSPGDAARLVDISVTLARHGVLVATRRGPTLVVAPRSQAPRAVAVALRRSFADLGPTFVKLGQLMASSPGLFPPTLADEMRRLLDHVPPEPPRVARRTLERDLDLPLEAVFSHFDPEPIAAASIAQVHRARLVDGTDVAVKIRRPNLRGRIERDLRLLRLLARLAEWGWAIGSMANPVAIVEDLAETLAGELDLRVEAAAMAEFGHQRAVSSQPLAVLAPRPVPGLVGRRVLVMSFVEGVPIDHVDELRSAGHDLEAILRTAVQAWVESALVHGRFHGDVHAGNLFVTPAGEVAFLDFGITGTLDGEVLDVLRRTLPALFIGDYATVAGAVFALAGSHDQDSAAEAAADIERLAAPLLAAPLAEIRYGDVLAEVLAVAGRYRLRLPREFVLVAKQLVYFERYAKALAPDLAILADPGIVASLAGALAGGSR